MWWCRDPITAASSRITLQMSNYFQWLFPLIYQEWELHEFSLVYLLLFLANDFQNTPIEWLNSVAVLQYLSVFMAQVHHFCAHRSSKFLWSFALAWMKLVLQIGTLYLLLVYVISLKEFYFIFGMENWFANISYGRKNRSSTGQWTPTTFCFHPWHWWLAGSR